MSHKYFTSFDGELWLDRGRAMLAAFGAEHDVTCVFADSKMAGRLATNHDNDSLDYTVPISIEVRYKFTPARPARMGSISMAPEDPESEDIEVTSLSFTDGDFSVDAMDLISSPGSKFATSLYEELSEDGLLSRGGSDFEENDDESDWRKAD